MNEEATRSSTDIIYPDKKTYRLLLKTTQKYTSCNEAEEMKKYSEVADAFEHLGVNYEKLLRPLIVMRHHAPRSVFSLIHLTLNRAPAKER